MKRITTALLGELRQEVVSSGASFLLAYLPVGQEIGTAGTPTLGMALFGEFCAKRPSECVDVRPAFLAELKSGLPLQTLGHWDRREHHIAARVLADSVREKDSHRE